MKYLILIAFLPLFFISTKTAKAEGLYLTIGAGMNGHFFDDGGDNWNDNNGTGAFLALSYQWNKQNWCFNCYPSINYIHISQWDVGPPFNDDDEDWVDHIGGALTWGFFEK